MSIHKPLMEISFIMLTISPGELSIPIFLSIHKIPYIFAFILVGLYSFSIRFIISPLSFILCLVIGSEEVAFPFKLVLFESSFIIRSVGQYKEPIVAYSFSVVKLSNEVKPICGVYFSFSVLSSI